MLHQGMSILQPYEVCKGFAEKANSVKQNQTNGAVWSLSTMLAQANLS